MGALLFREFEGGHGAGEGGPQGTSHGFNLLVVLDGGHPRNEVTIVIPVGFFEVTAAVVHL